MLDPIAILVLGVLTVIGLILVLRVNAFIALICSAVLVSLLSKGELGEKISRVAEAFGSTAGKIGIVIALAAVIGKCLMDSGAADRIVRAFLRLLGEKRASTALMGSGFVLAMPVFFDTVFYLLVPLARSLWKKTGHNYMLYITAIAAGAAITHTLVPPTPGPLIMAETLGFDVGMMILVGTLIGLPTAAVGLVVCKWMNRLLDLPMRPYAGEVERKPLEDDQLPPLWMALLPIVLPVLLIASNTVMKALVDQKHAALTVSGNAFDWYRLAEVTNVLGNPNLALLLSAALAMGMLKRQRGLSWSDLGQSTETALMSGGVIILITAGGGAFGAMLREAGIGKSIERLFDTDATGYGIALLLMGFGVAAVMKVAQGSSTVSMITTSSMLAAMIGSSESLGYHPVYLASAIGCGSLCGSWMNDSGFWIFARMSVLSEVEALKSWTILLTILGITGMSFTLLAAWLLPLT